MNTSLRGLESFGRKHCVDPGKVSTDFQQKWQVHVHRVISGNTCIRIPTDSKNTQPRRDHLTDCCVGGQKVFLGQSLAEQSHF